MFQEKTPRVADRQHWIVSELQYCCKNSQSFDCIKDNNNNRKMDIEVQLAFLSGGHAQAMFHSVPIEWCLHGCVGLQSW